MKPKENSKPCEKCGGGKEYADCQGHKVWKVCTCKESSKQKGYGQSVPTLDIERSCGKENSKPQSPADLSDEERKELTLKVVKEANKEQRRIAEKNSKLMHKK